MSKQPSYEELAETIAQCVHARMYQEEPHQNRWKKTVDNMASTAYQIPTGVLNRLDILNPLDDTGRRNDFTCLPDEIQQSNRPEQNQGV